MEDANRPPLAAGSHAARSILFGGAASRLLARGGATLLLEAPLSRGAARLGRAAPARNAQTGGDLLGEALQRELPVAGLPPRLLGDGSDDGAGAFAQPCPL